MPRLTLRSFCEAALTLLLPIECAVCQAIDTRLCAGCHAQLRRERFADEDMIRAVDVPFPVIAAAPYAGVTRDCLLQLKELGRTDVRTPLAELLERAVTRVRSEHPNETLWCVPMPSTRKNEAKRGYNHLELVMRSLPSQPEPHRWLHAAASRADQVGLTATERAHNALNTITVKPRMRAHDAIAGKSVLLIDDIATTGSSLRAAAAALEDAGAHVVAAAVIAHTPKLAEG